MTMKDTFEATLFGAAIVIMFGAMALAAQALGV